MRIEINVAWLTSDNILHHSFPFELCKVNLRTFSAAVTIGSSLAYPLFWQNDFYFGNRLHSVNINHSPIFTLLPSVQFSSVTQSCQTPCDPMDCRTPGLPVHHQLPELAQTHVHWWCHPTISSSVVPFSSCLQSFPASWSFLMSQFFTSGGQSIGASASATVLPMNIQDWVPLPYKWSIP